MDIESLFRPHLLKLNTTQNPRKGFEGIYLDYNENPFGSPDGGGYNRYPEPFQHQLKEKISKIKGVPPENMMLGNGSDEIIDFLFRIFCEPGKDQAIICPPTYDRYQNWADVNNVSVINVNLTKTFQLDVPAIVQAIEKNENLKLLFICSPNNPSGNALRYDDIEFLLNNFPGIVVIDEAYINFSRQRSFIRELTEYENLVVLQTFSKAWGMAGLRLGMAFSSGIIIDMLNKVRSPGNIDRAVMHIVSNALDNIETVNRQIKILVEERNKLMQALKEQKLAEELFHSDANIVLARFKDAVKLYEWLKENGILVSDSTQMPMCENCLRLSVGKPEENLALIEKIGAFYKK